MNVSGVRMEVGTGGDQSMGRSVKVQGLKGATCTSLYEWE